MKRSKEWQNGVAVLGVMWGVIGMAAMAVAQPSITQKWEQQAWSSTQAAPGSPHVTIEEVCPTTPDFSFTVSDPIGDIFGFGPGQHDITAISGTGDVSTFCLTVEFAGPVDPADAGSGQEVVGFIEFDTDENATTGFPGNVDLFCPTPAGIGVEVTLDMFSVSGGFGTLLPSGDLVPVVFTENSFTAAIPLAALGGDNSFNFAAVLGTMAEPTDCAPNGGSIHSPDGSIVPAPTIGSISGRVVDAASGEPLPGDSFPFAFVELYRCSDEFCGFLQFVSVQATDQEGRFRFDQSTVGVPLLAGTYQVRAFAQQYQQGQTDFFGVAEGEDHEVGDLPLTPFTVQFSEVQPCPDLSLLGGTCVYRVGIRNNDPATPLEGLVWSIVQAGFTQFQTGAFSPLLPLPHAVRLDPGESQILPFAFEVPGTVPDGTFICPQIFVGQEPTPFFHIVGQAAPLFCLTKGVSGFAVVPEEQARARQQQQQVREAARQGREQAVGR